MADDDDLNYASSRSPALVVMWKSSATLDPIWRAQAEVLVVNIESAPTLFTSRGQMEARHAALPKDLSGQVQMQGECSRNAWLAERGRRVARGKRSIIFGLQSFGEGIDLPGPLCEHVVIDKLPFTPPQLRWRKRWPNG
ncbi:putative ATP-dependent helicase DinG (plasmid) [Variovorax sp. SRS16]|nr:helicase C-terminal domain-containing protein [Variovorax sp. SRS16]VTU46215.1 putative ATP-dependent helicase DinG [Variovorax sp. SRS16]